MFIFAMETNSQSFLL